jgi:hypothetical protein
MKFTFVPLKTIGNDLKTKIIIPTVFERIKTFKSSIYNKITDKKITDKENLKLELKGKK